MSEQVNITNEGNGFGSIHLLAHFNNHVVGRAIALVVGKTALLEEFGVEKSSRKNGIGTALLDEAEKLAKEAGASSMKRIGMFCDANSIPDYFSIVKFLKKRGYSYHIVYLSKSLK